MSVFTETKNSFTVTRQGSSPVTFKFEERNRVVAEGASGNDALIISVSDLAHMLCKAAMCGNENS